MAKDKYYGKTLRKNFARHEEVMAMPNLLEIQKKSYQWFLDTGLREVFADVASIGDYAGNLELSFIDYSMDEKPKYDVEECKARDATYAAPMKVSVRLHNKETGEIKELNRKAGKLSGGERQRVAIARAIVCDQPIILADEPTGSLDAANKANVMDILMRLCKESGKTLIIVTHDPSIAERCDRIVQMTDGRIEGNGESLP